MPGVFLRFRHRMMLAGATASLTDEQRIEENSMRGLTRKLGGKLQRSGRNGRNWKLLQDCCLPYKILNFSFENNQMLLFYISKVIQDLNEIETKVMNNHCWPVCVEVLKH